MQAETLLMDYEPPNQTTN